MAKYEVWKKLNINNRKALPEETFYTLDSAMSLSIAISKTKQTETKFDYSKYPYRSFQEEVPVDTLVIERTTASKVRGFGIEGKWLDARECKKCSNSGVDQNDQSKSCPACKGSSWKPRI